jgi:hypothetical protein
MNIKVILEGIWGAITIGFTIIFSPLLRPAYRHWGMSRAEAFQPLPGDEYVPRPRSEVNAAVTVKAPADKIWPWFVQLGCQRAGWYSYDLLDNGGEPSAAQILPQFQQLTVGDTIKALPNGAFGFPVAAFIPNEFLTLGGTMDTKNGTSGDPRHPPAEFFSGDQTFVLQPLPDGSTRLKFRMRTDWNSSFVINLVYRGIVEPISFIMGRKMLVNIKKRAERLDNRV